MQYEQSKAWHERACRVIPAGVNSNIRAYSHPVPLCYERAQGARLWDVDGNEYIDYVLSQGPMVFGHNPQPIVDAIKAQADQGLVLAGQCKQEIEAAELLVELVPCAEKVRFCTTGSEAVHAALRIARAATGRKQVLRFEGHYHGWLDTIAWNLPMPGADLGPADNPHLRPSSKGQCEEFATNLIQRPWNDVPRLEKAFEENGDDLAAVICDPYASACGIIPAEPDFLQRLRELCDQHGVVLIFDEVITGFRVGLGGAQDLYGITPDLATFAKALGGGVTVGAVAGRAAIMDVLTDLKTTHAGTYNGNPLVMAGTLAALRMLQEGDGAILKHAQIVGQKLWDGLADISAAAGHPLTFRGVPNVFSATFLPTDAKPVTDYRSSLQADRDKLTQLWVLLQEHGVQITLFGIWFVSTAHTEEDVGETLQAAERAFAAL
jgi:glutamate-1-semialdehyde 2,1-aminomutase